MQITNLVGTVWPVVMLAGLTIGSEPTELAKGPLELSDIITSANANTDIMQQAMTAIDRLGAADSCDKRAAQVLLEKCDGLAPHAQHPYDATNVENVDNIKNLFAVQMALCEIERASIAVPPTCVELVTQVVTNPSHTFMCVVFGRCNEPAASHLEYDNVTAQACISKLYNEPQTWTSFSNALQSAHPLCEIAQRRHERDAFVDMVKVILNSINVTANMSASQAASFFDAVSSHTAQLRAVLQRLNVLADLADTHTSNTVAYMRTNFEDLTHSTTTLATLVHTFAQQFADVADRAIATTKELNDVADVALVNAYINAGALKDAQIANLGLAHNLNKQLSHALNESASLVGLLHVRSSGAFSSGSIALSQYELYVMIAMIVGLGLVLGQYGVILALILTGHWYFGTRVLSCAVLGLCF